MSCRSHALCRTEGVFCKSLIIKDLVKVNFVLGNGKTLMDLQPANVNQKSGDESNLRRHESLEHMYTKQLATM